MEENWLDRFDDRLNPVLVKELRQSVGALFILSGLMLIALLAALYLTVLVRPDQADDMFDAITVILGLAWQVSAVMFGLRFSSERSGDDDLIFITPLSPLRMVVGKLCSILTVDLFFLFLALPFIFSGYVLSGVGATEIFSALLLLVIISLPVSALSLMLGGIRTRNRNRNGMVIFAGFFGLGLLSLLPEAQFFNVMSFFNAGVISLGTTAVFLLLAVGALIPAGGNRTFAGKIAAAVTVAAITAMSFMPQQHKIELPLSALLLTVFMGLVGCFEPLAPSSRILSGVPRTKLLRPLYFLFSGNALSSLLYFPLLAAVALIPGWCGISEAKKSVHEMLTLCLCIWGYVMLVLLFRRLFASFGMKRENVPGTAFAVVAVLVFTYSLFGMITIENLGVSAGLLCFSPVVLTVADDASTGILGGIFMCVVFGVALMPHLCRTIGKFMRKN